MLVDMGVHTERTPSISCDKEVLEPHLTLELVGNPHLKVLPFYPVFHNIL
jgi:hypothetical protein